MRSLLLTSALALLLVTPCVAAQKPLRVLVDASKDGGLWWFPQGRGNTFDPALEHQGKPLADFMRSKGWEVVELGRGEVITPETFRDVDVVIRPPVFFDYTVDEVVAYRDSVMGGMRLLLMGGGGGTDSVAAIFGLRFDMRSRFASVRQWIPHPLSANITNKDLPWTSVTESPENAVQLAWLNQGQPNSRPVLGYLPYGSGYVVFVGHPFISPDPDRTFFGSLVGSLSRYSLEEIKQLPVQAAVAAEAPTERGPRLLTPVADATLPQPQVSEWRFDWTDVPGAKAYEIVVLGSSAIVPLVHTTTRTSDYVWRSRDGYIADHNLLGWSWRVRARNGNGEWGEWSLIRRFNVSPLH